MTFELAFLEPALKEWKKLDRTIRDQFESRLAERIENPRIAPATDSSTKCAIRGGRRDRDAVYLAAMKR